MKKKKTHTTHTEASHTRTHRIEPGHMCMHTHTEHNPTTPECVEEAPLAKQVLQTNASSTPPRHPTRDRGPYSAQATCLVQKTAPVTRPGRYSGQTLQPHACTHAMRRHDRNRCAHATTPQRAETTNPLPRTRSLDRAPTCRHIGGHVQRATITRHNDTRNKTPTQHKAHARWRTAVFAGAPAQERVGQRRRQPLPLAMPRIARTRTCVGACAAAAAV